MKKLSLVVVFLGMAAGMSGQDRAGARLPSTANGEWLHYTADLRGSRGVRR
jgi:hypothetical protein